jgi:hypothetical protein
MPDRVCDFILLDTGLFYIYARQHITFRTYARQHVILHLRQLGVQLRLSDSTLKREQILVLYCG